MLKEVSRETFTTNKLICHMCALVYVGDTGVTTTQHLREAAYRKAKRLAELINQKLQAWNVPDLMTEPAVTQLYIMANRTLRASHYTRRYLRLFDIFNPKPLHQNDIYPPIPMFEIEIDGVKFRIVYYPFNNQVAIEEVLRK